MLVRPAEGNWGEDLPQIPKRAGDEGDRKVENDTLVGTARDECWERRRDEVTRRDVSALLKGVKMHGGRRKQKDCKKRKQEELGESLARSDLGRSRTPRMALETNRGRSRKNRS